MKKTAKFITALFLGSIISVYAISGKDPARPEKSEKYCAMLQNGKRVVMHMGSPITADVTLNDGTTIKPNGIVTRSDGRTTIMTSGQCISKDGIACEEKHIDKDKKPK